MKYLKNYLNFLKPLLEEVEVKYSQSMYDWLMSCYNELPTGMSNEEYRSIQQFEFFPVNEIIYESYPIKLGSIAWCLWSDTEIDDKIILDLLKTVNESEVKFDSLKDIIGQEKFDHLMIKRDFPLIVMFFSEGKRTDGSALGGSWRVAQFDLNERLLKCVISLNKNEESVKIHGGINIIIRHELQHFTQFLNTMFLNIGESLIEQNFNSNILLEKLFTDSIKKATENFRVGLGKTKTGYGQYSPFEDEKLSAQFNKIHKNDNLIIDTEEEKEIAKNLRYVSSDEEYKTILTDIVEKMVNTAFESSETLSKLSDFFKLYKKYQDIIDNISISENLSEEEKRKIQMRKELSEFAKERGKPYLEVLKKIKKLKDLVDLNINNIYKNIVGTGPDSNRIKILFQTRKETPASLMKLIRKKVEERLLK